MISIQLLHSISFGKEIEKHCKWSQYNCCVRLHSHKIYLEYFPYTRLQSCIVKLLQNLSWVLFIHSLSICRIQDLIAMMMMMMMMMMYCQAVSTIKWHKITAEKEKSNGTRGSISSVRWLSVSKVDCACLRHLQNQILIPLLILTAPLFAWWSPSSSLRSFNCVSSTRIVLPDIVCLSVIKSSSYRISRGCSLWMSREDDQRSSSRVTQAAGSAKVTANLVFETDLKKDISSLIPSSNWQTVSQRF